jgi:hypothetical protein
MVDSVQRDMVEPLRHNRIPERPVWNLAQDGQSDLAAG